METNSVPHMPAALAIGFMVVIILIYFLLDDSRRYEDYIGGLWYASASSKFSKTSDIDSMMLYIGPYKNGERHCYIVITDDIANEKLSLKYSPTWKNIFGSSEYSITSKVLFESDDDPLWDEKNITIKINIAKGTLIIEGTKDKIILADLVKSHEVTNED